MVYNGSTAHGKYSYPKFPLVVKQACKQETTAYKLSGELCLIHHLFDSGCLPLVSFSIHVMFLIYKSFCYSKNEQIILILTVSEGANCEMRTAERTC